MGPLPPPCQPRNWGPTVSACRCGSVSFIPSAPTQGNWKQLGSVQPAPAGLPSRGAVRGSSSRSKGGRFLMRAASPGPLRSGSSCPVGVGHQPLPCPPQAGSPSPSYFCELQNLLSHLVLFAKLAKSGRDRRPGGVRTSHLLSSSEDCISPVGGLPSWHPGLAMTLGVHTVGANGTEGRPQNLILGWDSSEERSVWFLRAPGAPPVSCVLTLPGWALPPPYPLLSYFPACWSICPALESWSQLSVVGLTVSLKHETFKS